MILVPEGQRGEIPRMRLLGEAVDKQQVWQRLVAPVQVVQAHAVDFGVTVGRDGRFSDGQTGGTGSGNYFESGSAH